jgi:AcrR family transcriptional regulator
MSSKKTESLNRALDVAADMFFARGVDGVSVAEISADARCSLATIYDVFGSKTGLLRAVLEQRFAPVPCIAQLDAPPALAPLLDYFADRIATLGSVEVRNVLRYGGAEPGALQGSYEVALRRNRSLASVIREVRQAMEAGLLRDGDPADLAFLMMAGTGFEPVMYGLLFGDEVGRYPTAILRSVFAPLVTPRGGVELRAYLESLEAANPERPGPALTGFLRDDDGPEGQ